MEHLESLAAKAPFGNGRMTLGFAFDGFNLPKEVVAPIFHKIKSLGVKTWTCHYRHGPIQGVLFLGFALSESNQGLIRIFFLPGDVERLWYTRFVRSPLQRQQRYS
jgi:hypothetical protein